MGDDVVFGSRSVILTSSATRSAPVVFEAGSMVADRCVILPGVKLRRAAVLGKLNYGQLQCVVTESSDIFKSEALVHRCITFLETNVHTD